MSSAKFFAALEGDYAPFVCAPSYMKKATGQRVKLAPHAFGLCLQVHMSGEPEAKDCCACRGVLCPMCIHAQARLAYEALFKKSDGT